eukprot:g4452.t1
MATPPAAPHKLPVTVFIGDTDAYRMMYHTNYLIYYARARFEVLDLREVARLQRECGLVLVERRVLHVRFFDSARLGEECVVETTLFGTSETTLTFNHCFVRGADGSGKTLNRAVVEVGFVDASGAPVPVPGSVFDTARPTIPPCALPRVFGGAPARLAGDANACVAEGGAAHAMLLRGFADLCDASGQLQLHLVLDQFERARSTGMGGPVTLQRCQEESDHIFVVGRMDHIRCGGAGADGEAAAVAAAPALQLPRFGDELEVRTVVELKYRNVCIVFHHQLWYRGGGAGSTSTAGSSGDRPLVEAAVSVYSISAKDKSPVPVPSWLEQMMAPFMLKR